MTLITTSAAITDEHLLAPSFAGPSWATWRAVLPAAERLPLDEDQQRLFRGVAEQDPPRPRARELWSPGESIQTSLAPNSLEAGHAISDRIGNPRSKFQRKNSERLAGPPLDFPDGRPTAQVIEDQP
jgi:hypothetical protein